MNSSSGHPKGGGSWMNRRARRGVMEETLPLAEGSPCLDAQGPSGHDLEPHPVLLAGVPAVTRICLDHGSPDRPVSPLPKVVHQLPGPEHLRIRTASLFDAGADHTDLGLA